MRNSLVSDQRRIAFSRLNVPFKRSCPEFQNLSEGDCRTVVALTYLPALFCKCKYARNVSCYSKLFYVLF